MIEPLVLLRLVVVPSRETAETAKTVRDAYLYLFFFSILFSNFVTICT